MSVALRDGSIVLVGACGVEEAEVLVSLIHGNPGAVVDLSEAGLVHTALWQALLALTPPVTGELHDPFLGKWLGPHLFRTTAERRLNLPQAGGAHTDGQKK